MSSNSIRMGLAVRQVDADLVNTIHHYPSGLPSTHLARLRWDKPRLKLVGQVLVGCSPEAFAGLSPLLRQLEVNRAYAEAILARARAGEVTLEADEKEALTQRALGILPTEEDARVLEVASCPELSPNYMTSSAERFVRGLAEIEQHMGQATALCYGGLLMAGVRSPEDLEKYGGRVESLFEAVVSRGPVESALAQMHRTGVLHAGYDERLRLVRAVREQLWAAKSSRSGKPFLLTQVIDGYLGLRAGGVGDDLGLALVDSIIVTKLAFPVSYLFTRKGVLVEILISPAAFEHWNPLDRKDDGRTSRGRSGAVLELLVEGYTRMARGYANTKSFQHGARVAQWVLDIKPGAEAYQILGQCLLGEQQPAEAIAACAKALEFDRRMADAYMVQGNAYSTMNRWPEAVECYRRAIHCRPDSAEACNNIALALFRNGQTEKAIAAYNDAVRLRPDYAEAYYNLGNLHFERAQGMADEAEAAKEFARAAEAYGRAVERAPDFAGAHYNMGQAHYARKDLPAALAAYQAAVKANPKHAGAWHNMGIVYRDMGHQELAVDALEKAVTLNPILLR